LALRSGVLKLSSFMSFSLSLLLSLSFTSSTFAFEDKKGRHSVCIWDVGGK
ncbi:hypothetical protein CHS0354_013729, partial [Potamilus streckersoni]